MDLKKMEEENEFLEKAKRYPSMMIEYMKS